MTRDIWTRKAQSTIRLHGNTPSARTRLIGWTVERVANLLRTDWEGTCNYCDLPYAGMKNGLREITIEIIDDGPWDIDTNVMTCCNSCNAAKGQRNLAEWEQYRPNKQAWRSRPIAARILAHKHRGIVSQLSFSF